MGTQRISDTAIFYGDKRNSGDYDNGVWMDILQVPFLQKIDEAGPYKVLIHTMWLDAIGWHKEIKNRWPDKVLIGLSDHPLSTHISKLSADRQVAYIKDLEYLDGIMALTEEEREWYQTAVPSKPVIKVGLPFPFEPYMQKYNKFQNSEKKYIGLGVGASDNDRNFISSVIAFSNLKLIYPDITGVFLSVPQQLIGYCSYLADNFEGIYIHERKDMGSFYDILSQCKFVINLADRNTPGRLQGEAAFFRIPVIGSNRLELQNELFPKLAVTPYQTERVVQLGSLLLENESLGEALGLNAYRKLQAYDYRKSKARFNKLLGEIKSKSG